MTLYYSIVYYNTIHDEHLDPAGLVPALELRGDHGGNL